MNKSIIFVFYRSNGLLNFDKNMWEKFKKADKVLLILLFLSIGLLLYSSTYLVNYYRFNKILTSYPRNDYTENNETKKLSPNEIGDSIGGTLNPIISITASIITFLAFYIQYQANKAQTEQFNRQELDKHADEVERRFYEMLKIHRDNVNELNIEIINDNTIFIKNGRECFKYFYEEFKLCYEYIKNYIKQTYTETPEENKDLYTTIAYIVFYFGTRDALEHNKFAYRNTKDKKKEDVHAFLSSKSLIESIDHAKKKQYKQGDYYSIPFFGKINAIEQNKHYDTKALKSYFAEGHSSKLGHYYRHLFQTVEYIAEQKKEIISQSKKENYLKTLRAQLSDYEQLMLYYNAISGFGEDWIENKYFSDYEMIKDMPIALANFGIEPKDQFTEEELKKIFDWYE